MKLNYNVYLNNSPKPVGKNDIVLNGSIDSDGRLLSVSGIKVHGRDLTPSGGSDTDIPKVWGYYGHDKTAIEMKVCAEYCKYIIENIANGSYSDKYNILRSNKGLSLTTSDQASGYWFDAFGSNRYLNLSDPSALNDEVTSAAQLSAADCTNVLKYLDILLNMQNELVEYQTKQTVPIMDYFNIIGEAISAVESMIGIMGGNKEIYYLGPDENTIFTYTATEIDGKYTYTISSQSKDPKHTVLKISEDDLLFLLNYVGATQKMGLTSLISTDLLLSGIDQESGSGGDDPIMDVN